MDNGCARLRGPAPPLTDICAFIGDSVQFQCVRDGGDPSATTPMIRTPGGMVIQGTSTINISPAARGNFECFSRTVQCNETRRELRVQVYGEQNTNVHSIPLHQYCTTLSPAPPVIDTMVALPSVPNFVIAGVGRANVTASMGITVLVYCPATTGIPEAMIRLERRVGGTLIPVDSNRVTNVNLNGIPTLLYSILSFVGSDEGEYVCTTENIAGSDRRSVHVISTGEECSF